ISGGPGGTSTSTTSVTSTFQPLCIDGYYGADGGCYPIPKLNSSAQGVLSTVYGNTSGLTQVTTWTQATGASMIAGGVGVAAFTALSSTSLVVTVSGAAAAS